MMKTKTCCFLLLLFMAPILWAQNQNALAKDRAAIYKQHKVKTITVHRTQKDDPEALLPVQFLYKTKKLDTEGYAMRVEAMEGEGTYIYTISRNADHQTKKMVLSNADNKVLYSYHYAYKNGKIATYIVKFPDGKTVMNYHYKNGLLDYITEKKSDKREEMVYDKNGNLIEKHLLSNQDKLLGYQNKSTWTYKYNAHNHLIEEHHCESPITCFIKKYTYNEQQQLVQVSIYSDAGNEIERDVFTFYENGLLKSQAHYEDRALITVIAGLDEEPYTIDTYTYEYY